jgi:MFS family permease
MSSLKPDPAGLHFGPLWFTPGLTGTNIATVNFAAFSTISIITFMSFVQPYVLTEMLHIPAERQGTFTGNLAALQEVVVILLMGFFGAWSDRVGRRTVFVIGFGLLAFGYFIYPLATSESQLMVFRVIFAVGGACAPIMLSATIQDTCQEVSRGKWVAFNSIFTGFGVIFMALVLAKTPQWYGELGADPISAGRYAFWTTTAFCLLAAGVVWLGLKRGVTSVSKQPNIFRQIGAGFSAAADNPRLAVSYGAAFVGRGDLVIISTFLSLWVVQYGAEQNIPTSESLTKAGILFGIIQTAALLWAWVMGTISDRVNRMTSLCIALVIATVGYSAIGFVTDPFGRMMIPAALLMGMGEISVLIAAGAVVGQEAPVRMRGAVIGVFGLLGGVGIMFATFVGGLVFDNIGRTAPFVMMGILNFVLLGVAVWVRLRTSATTESAMKLTADTTK